MAMVLTAVSEAPADKYYFMGHFFVSLIGSLDIIVVDERGALQKKFRNH